MESGIAFGGVYYTLDLERLADVLAVKSDNKDGKITEKESKTSFDADGKPFESHVTVREYEKGTEINGPKYDVVRMCLEILLTYTEEVDDALGSVRALQGTTIPFKVAFNTLLQYDILKEEEVDEE